MEIKNSKLDWHKRTNPHTFFQYESRLNFDPNLLTSGSKIATLSRWVFKKLEVRT